MKGMLAVFVMLALPAAAQENRPAAGAGGGHGSGGGGPHSAAGPSSGGSSASGGASTGGSASSGGASSGGAMSAGSSGGGSRAEAGGKHAASGGSGVAVTRGGERGSYASGGRHGDGGTINGGGSAPATPSGSVGNPRASSRSEGTPRSDRPGEGSVTGVPPHARPRGDEPIVGTAVPRGSVPPATGPGGSIGTGGVGYYPWWWFGGAGFYGGYYGYSNYYGYNNYFGGPGAYYGYYDPWFGGYPDMQEPATGGGGFTPSVEEGSLKLKIKPRDAEVYVDGFYVGVVDDFDGMFQKLHIETGPHRIEVRAPGYESLVFDVRISTDHATTYQGELKRIK